MPIGAEAKPGGDLVFEPSDGLEVGQAVPPEELDGGEDLGVPAQGKGGGEEAVGLAGVWP